MRIILTAWLTLVAIGLFTASLWAAPVGGVAQRNATPFTQLAQGYYYGGQYYGAYRPACPERYYSA